MLSNIGFFPWKSVGSAKPTHLSLLEYAELMISNNNYQLIINGVNAFVLFELQNGSEQIGFAKADFREP